MRYLFLLFALSACTGTETAKIFDSETFYKRDIRIVEGNDSYFGVAVLPAKSAYSIAMKFSGQLDLFTFTDCHQQIARERAGSGGIFGRKNEIRIEYNPSFSGGEYCPIEIGGYEAVKGRHSWGFIDFKTPKENLPAEIQCNGSTEAYVGVSICQSLQGLLQRITFPNPTRVSTSASCEPLELKDGGLWYEFPMPKGRCVYAFQEIDGAKRFHRLTTLGYEKILIKEVRP